MYRRMFFILLITVGVCLTTPLLAATKVVHQKQRLPQDHYMVDLLKIAFDHIGTDYQLVEINDVLSKDRIKESLSNGDLSVMWTGSSKQMDENFMPVHIPAYKGLMGHRIFIIRQGDQARFNNIHTLAALKTVKFGQGKAWSDTKILGNAGFTVVTSMKFEGLFYMLEGGRFDAFPRGVHEPWMEVSSRDHLNLTVEKNLVLKYVMPYYFYVAKDNRELAKDLTEGLELAIADGTFDEHFYNDPEVKSALANSNLKDRTILPIVNPDVSGSVPVDKPELWLDLSKLSLVSSE